MICQQCGSSRSVFPSEIAIHFPGFPNVDKRAVMAFPKLHLCLACGNTQFELPEKERNELKEGLGLNGVAA